MELPAPDEISNFNKNAMKPPSSSYDDPFGDMSSPATPPPLAATLSSSDGISSQQQQAPPSVMNPFAMGGDPWSTPTTTPTATMTSSEDVDESPNNSNHSTPPMSNTATKIDKITSSGDDNNDDNDMALSREYNNSNHSGNNDDVVPIVKSPSNQLLGEYSNNTSNHSGTNGDATDTPPTVRSASNQLLGEYNNNNNNQIKAGGDDNDDDDGFIPTPTFTSDQLLGDYSSSQTTTTENHQQPPPDGTTMNMMVDAYDPEPGLFGGGGPVLFGGEPAPNNITDDATEASEDFRAGYVASINAGMTTTGTTDGGGGDETTMTMGAGIGGGETDKHTTAGDAAAVTKVGAVSVTLEELSEIGEKERQFANDKPAAAAATTTTVSTTVEEKMEDVDITTTDDKDEDPFESLPLITPTTTATTTMEKESESNRPSPNANQRSVRFQIPDGSAADNDPSLAPMVIPSTTTGKRPRASDDDDGGGVVDEDVESKKGLLVPSGSADAATTASPSPAGGGSSNDAGNKKTRTACIAFIVIFSILIAGGVVFLFVYWIPKSKTTADPDVEDEPNETAVALNNSRTAAFDVIKSHSLATIPAVTHDELPAMAAQSNATAQLKAAHWKIYDDGGADQQPPNATEARFLPRYALATLYYATTENVSSSWTNATNWLSDEDECNWYGLTCRNDTHRVMTELKLPSNNLIGTIPPEVGLLTTLTDFVLTKNNLTGLPPWEPALLTRMVELELLDLRENMLEGNISQLDFKTLSKLEDLLLSHNRFGGGVPQNTMLPSSLETFNFDNNNMTGSIPDIFCKEFQFTADCLNDTPISCTCCDTNSTMYRCV